MSPFQRSPKSSNNKNKLRFLPILLFSIFIIWIIVQADLGVENPFVSFVHQIPWGDKIGHICVFACLTFLLNYAFSYAAFKCLKVDLLTGSTLVFCFALIEELTQLFFASRTFDFLDILSDSIGILLASIFAYQKLYAKPQ